MKKAIQRRYKFIIWSLSIVIPVVVVILFQVRIPNVAALMFLPPIYATINGLTALLLLLAVRQIKRGNRASHERLMKLATSRRTGNPCRRIFTTSSSPR